MNKLELSVENVRPESIPNLARFAHYIGVVAQINGSLIESVSINGGRGRGPEQTTPNGKHLRLGAAALPDMTAAKPADIAAWCGVSLHGFAHSRYSPRTNEPLRHTLARKKLHPTWNMIEDARIERLLLREFPGWQPHLMGACNHLFFGDGANLSGVYPLIVGRTYLPAALRQESYEAFAAEHSEYIADAVHDLVHRYLTVVDPGSEDHDLTMDIVTRLHALLGDMGTDCGSHGVDDDAEREWADPGDPSEDEDEDVDPDADPDDDGNHEVTDGEGDDDGDEGEPGDDDVDEVEHTEPGDEGEPGDDDGDEGDADGGSDGESDEDGDDGDADGGSADDGDADGESDGDADGGGDSDGDPEGTDEDADDVGDTDGSDEEDGHGDGSMGEGQSTSRLADWSEAIDSALSQDERLNDAAEAITSGPMPLIALPQRRVELEAVPVDVQQAELDIARELRVLMDGARPGMRRRVERGRFNVTRVVREGGSTRPEEMFDRHDPGALRSTGCAVAVLADVSGSMRGHQLSGAMQSVWSIDRAVQSVRGSFKGYTFGIDSEELPSSRAEGVWVPMYTDGGTNPLLGLSSAQAWLSQQREPNKLCIVATDGAWNSQRESANVIDSMVASGVQVAVFGIDCDVSHHFRPTSGVTTVNVRSAADMGPAIGEMLVGRVRKSLHR